MLKKSVLTLVVAASLTMLAACGGGPTPPTTAPVGTPGGGVSVGPTAASQPTSVPAAATATSAPVSAGPTAAATTAGTPVPTRTPDNSVATVDPNAGNTSFQSAKALTKDPLKISVKESTFYYKIEVARGGIISATLSVDAGSPAPARLQLYDELQNYINQTDVPVGRSGQLKYIFNQKGGGTTYLIVQGNSNVTLTGQALTQSDGNSKGDAGDFFDTATLIQPGQLTGLLGDGDTEDYYVLDLPKTGGVLSTAIKTADGSVKVTVFDDNQNYFGETASDKNKPQAGMYQTLLAQNQGGRWFVRVGGSGTYTLTSSFGAQNDGASGKDAGNDFDGATTLKPGAYTGVLGGSDPDDYYALDLTRAGGVLSVTVKTTDGALNAEIYDDKLNYIGQAASEKSQAQPGFYDVVLPLNQGGKWYIDVRGEGSYSLAYAFTQQNDAGSAKDAGDSQESALPIGKATIDGSMGPNDNDDYYKVQGTLGRKLSIRYGASAVSLQVTLYDGNLNFLTNVSVEGGKTATLADDSGATGDYYIVVENGNGDYHITISK